MTVDELIDILKRVKDQYGGETEVRLEAYTHSNCYDKVFNTDTEIANVFLRSFGWTYDLNPDKFKIRSGLPSTMRNTYDNTRYLSLGAYTCDGCNHRFNCEHSDLGALDYGKYEGERINANLKALKDKLKGDSNGR